jgi:hypothetical protein
MSGFKRSGGERSNRYSESKYTNWSRYNPFDLEISALSKNMRSILEIATDSETIPIYARDLHTEFIRPTEVKDVAELLSRVPSDFLKSLRGISLLGGTSKQLRASKKRFQYGCYCNWSSQIYLYAYPRRMMKEYWGHLPKPEIVEEYSRMGAKWKPDCSGWWLIFDESSIRKFYLFDVLLHEIGHHVDRRSRRRDTTSAERYAEWFAQEYAQSILKPSDDIFAIN